MSKELEALENIKRDLEYITRLDYVEPIVRGEVRDNLFKIYHRELPELDIIETALKNYDKLSQLKDIEEDLGIDLVTFHKALKNGVYYKVTDKSSINYNKIFFDEHVLWGWNQNCDGTYFAMMQSQLQSFNLKDYGVTWALTKKELL